MTTRFIVAGLEWDLTEPIVINSADDFKSEPRWRERLKPYLDQVNNLMTFCRRLPVTLLADDVGLGKTITAGLVMSELAARGRLAKTLIVCPKILGRQWKEELETRFDIPAQVATRHAAGIFSMTDRSLIGAFPRASATLAIGKRAPDTDANSYADGSRAV
jgi:SNF2 family DNA or RNA helicase